MLLDAGNDNKVEAYVNITVFDIPGREVKVLLNGFEQKGMHTVSWDASGFSSGIYFCRMTPAGKNILKKMILVR